MAALAIGIMSWAPSIAVAQLTVSGRDASVRVGGLLQSQYSISSIDAAEDDFSVQRARLLTEVMVTDFLRGRVVSEFGDGTGRLLDADVSLHFSEAFTLSFGQFKRAFDIFELPDPGDLPLIDRDGRIEGYSPCSGVGSLCSYSRFTEELGFSGRDQGVRADGSSGEWTYQATVTNGTGLNAADANDRKSLSSRVGYALSDDVRVSGELGLHDYVDPSGSATALALGGDVEIGTWREGWHVRGAVVWGDNWSLLDASFDPATFFTFQGVATYYYPLLSERFAGLEPLARLSYADPDTDADDNSGLLFTPGVALYIVGRNRISANFDIYSPAVGDREFSFKMQSTLYF